MKPQELPHYGIKRGYSRKGKRVCIEPETKNEAGEVVPAVFRDFQSISRAKKYMRTGAV